MKLLILTSGEQVQLDDEDYNIFNEWSWYRNRDGYCYRNQRSGKLCLHIEIMKRIGYDNDLEIDHFDGNRLNCQKGNLRVATHSQNGANRGPQNNNSCGYKGVYYRPSRHKFQAQIKVNQVTIYLGIFSNVLAAAEAYNVAALKYFGKFAYQNPLGDL